jgi:hypothetical protein
MISKDDADVINAVKAKVEQALTASSVPAGEKELAQQANQLAQYVQNSLTNNAFATVIDKAKKLSE